MKTINILLFTIILSIAIQPNLRQNSLIAQEEIDPNDIPVSDPVCVDCGHNPCTCNSNETENEEEYSSSVGNKINIIESVIDLFIDIFSGSDSKDDQDDYEQLLLEQQEKLRKLAIKTEKQRILKEKIEKKINDKLMSLYKKLPGSGELKAKEYSDFFDGKPLSENEEDRAAKLKAARKDFIKTLNDDKTKYKTQLQKLEAIKTKVPPLGFKKERKVKSGCMLGLFNKESEYWFDTTKLKDPRTGLYFKPGEFFAGTDRITSFELYRGLFDSWSIGKFTLWTEYGKNLVERINGTHFETLIAHSNGATITEALIRAGHIKVDELNIIGGDRSLLNNDGYDELIKEYGVKKIIVWVNPNDLVPVGSSALKTFKNSITYNGDYDILFNKYLNKSIKGSGQDNPNIEYRFLEGPDYGACGQSYINSHGYDCYFENMKIYWEKNAKK